MKKAFALIMLFCILTFSSYSVALEARPDGALLNFSSPQGTIYIDIYINNGFIARLDGQSRNYELKSLNSNQEYNLSIAYRRADNSDISADFETFKTTSWDGVYEWVNNTDRDNKGRVKEIRFRVKTVKDPRYGQYNEVYMRAKNGEELRLFPLFDLGKAVSWVDYDGESDEARIYRENAERFNKSSIDPSRWRLTGMEVSPSRTVTYVDTRAIGLTIGCQTSFTFFVDEDGVYSMAFLVSGPSILSSFYFSCPDGESEDGSFILKRIN